MSASGPCAFGLTHSRNGVFFGWNGLFRSLLNPLPGPSQSPPSPILMAANDPPPEDHGAVPTHRQQAVTDLEHRPRRGCPTYGVTFGVRSNSEARVFSST